MAAWKKKDGQEVPKVKVPEPVEEVSEDGKWNVGAMVTATQPVLVNSETKEELDLYGAIAYILNKIDELE